MSQLDYQFSAYHNEKHKASPKKAGTQNLMNQSENQFDRTGQMQVKQLAADENYEYCPNCSRRFFIGRLEPHLKSCKAGKPLKPLKSISNNYENAYNSVDERKKSNQTFENLSRIAGEEEICKKAPGKLQSDPSSTQDELQEEEKEEIDYEDGDGEEISGCDDEEDSVEANLNKSDVESEKEQVAPGISGTVECRNCKRKFFEERIEKHEKACLNALKARPKFDIKSKRAIVDPITGAKLTNATNKNRSNLKETMSVISTKKSASANTAQDAGQASKPTVPKWKRDHENFINSIKFNKKLQKMEADGQDTSNMKPPETDNQDYVACSHCLRKFAPNVAEKHIPICKNTQNRPKPPKISTGEENNLMESKSRRLQTSLKKQNSQSDLEDVYDIRPKTQYNPLNYTDKPIEPVRSETSHKNTKRPEMRSSKSFNIRKTAMTIDISRNREAQIDLMSAGNQIESAKETNGFSALSPSNALGKLRKTIISEPLPKKETLLKNYENLQTKTINHSTVSCEYCQRNFAPKVAERHIPICKNLKNTRTIKPFFENGRIVRDTQKAPFSAGVDNPAPQKKLNLVNIDMIQEQDKPKF